VQNKFDVSAGTVVQYDGPVQIPYDLTWPKNAFFDAPHLPPCLSHNLPVIDFSAFTAGGTLIERRCCAEKLRHACRTAGFFAITNHGVRMEVHQAAFSSSRLFFAHAPQSEKMQCSNGYSSGYAPRKKGVDGSMIAERFTCHAHDFHDELPEGKYYNNEFAKLIFRKPLTFPEDSAPQFRQMLGAYNEDMRRLSSLV
jgi:isopenicillin N synthase-like dioxygenase